MKGWLTNFTVDGFVSKLNPPLGEAKPGTLRAYPPGRHSHSLQKTGSLGFDVYSGSDSHGFTGLGLSLERTSQLRVQVASVLAAL